MPTTTSSNPVETFTLFPVIFPPPFILIHSLCHPLFQCKTWQLGAAGWVNECTNNYIDECFTVKKHPGNNLQSGI